MSVLLRGVLATYPIGQLLARARERLKTARGSAWEPLYDQLARMGDVAWNRDVAMAVAESAVRGYLARARSLWPAIDDLDAVPSPRLVAMLELAEVTLAEIAAGVRRGPAPRLVGDLRELRDRASTAVHRLDASVVVDAHDLWRIASEVLDFLGVDDSREVSR